MCTENSLEYIKQEKRLMFKKAPMVQKKGQNMFNQDAEKEYRRLSQFVTTLNHPIDLTESEYKKYRNGLFSFCKTLSPIRQEFLFSYSACCINIFPAFPQRS